MNSTRNASRRRRRMKTNGRVLCQLLRNWVRSALQRGAFIIPRYPDRREEEIRVRSA